MRSPHRRNSLCATLCALLVVACGDGGASQTLDTTASATGPAETTGVETTSMVTTGSETSDAGTSTGETSDVGTSDALRPDLPPPDPCVAVGVIFFDLGDTLVEADGDLFVERPGASAMISELKALGMRVGIITNTPDNFTFEDLQALLVDPGFLDEFEFVLLSSEATAPPKPDPAIFVEAHAMLSDAPPIGEVAFVGENLAEIADLEASPTQGARAAGMLGVHLSAAAPSPLADLTIPPDQLDMLVSLAETRWLACARRDRGA